MPANISRVIYRRFFPSVIVFLYTAFFLRVNQIRDSAAVKLQQLPRMGKYIRQNTDTWAGSTHRRNCWTPAESKVRLKRGFCYVVLHLANRPGCAVQYTVPGLCKICTGGNESTGITNRHLSDRGGYILCVILYPEPGCESYPGNPDDKLGPDCSGHRDRRFGGWVHLCFSRWLAGQHYSDFFIRRGGCYSDFWHSALSSVQKVYFQVCHFYCRTPPVWAHF